MRLTPIDISRITNTYRNYLNPTPSANPIMGKQGTSLRNNDVQKVIKSIQKEQKNLARSKQELSLAPNPPDI